MSTVWTFLLENSGPLSVLLAGIPLLVTAIRYVNVRSSEAEREQFARYHEIIKRINVNHDPSDSNDLAPYLEVQISSVYELRRLPKYFPVTLRILERRKNTARHPALQEEILLAIKHIEMRMKSCVWAMKYEDKE
ncbi:hypothetical protein ACUDCK_16430 [Achromobacter sp. CF-sbj1-Ac2-l]|uniref:hypothetical protein n=1 Tax=Achromobacter TaxID=222 RepID=UPI00158367B2|nr:hypothetical protein [Achromobacter dolens]